MKMKYLCVSVLLILALTWSACASSQTVESSPTDQPAEPSPVTPSPAPTDTLVIGTPPVPTPLPGSTQVPWWGPTLHTFNTEPKYLSKPTGLAVAADSTIYLADAGNNRILHIDQQSNVLHVWGTFGKSEGDLIAPEGTFNEPWGIGLGPDGSVYVADTWNHRIQKFSAAGEFLLTWGGWGTGSDDPYQYWGPRDVVVSGTGFVYVTDTGNKRVVVYDQDGKYLSQIGSEGSQPGQFIEPVGLEISPDGELFVADQGNRRVQIFSIANNGSLTFKAEFSVDAWQNNTLEFKPFLCIVQDRLFLTDSEAGSVVEYSTSGEYRYTYSFNTTGYLNYGLLYGIAADPGGGIWVSDYAGGAGVVVKIIPQP